MRYCAPFCFCFFLLVFFVASDASSAECFASPGGKVVCPVPIATVVKSCDGPLCVVPGLIVPLTAKLLKAPCANTLTVKSVKSAKSASKVIKRTVRRVHWNPRWRTKRFFERSRSRRSLRGGGCCR